MLYEGTNIISFLLNLLSIISSIFACFVSIIILICIICHQYHTRIERQEKIILILSTNIYLSILMYYIALFQLNVSSLIGDLYGTNFDTIQCKFNGYFVSVLICALYYGYLVQVIIRFQNS